MTFLDLKNAFGSVSHQLIFDFKKQLKEVSYMLSVVTSKDWETVPILFQQGVFHGYAFSDCVP